MSINKILSGSFVNFIKLSKYFLILLMVLTIVLIGFSDNLAFQNHRKFLLHNSMIMALSIFGSLIFIAILRKSNFQFGKTRVLSFAVILISCLISFVIFFIGINNLFLGAWDSGGLFTSAWKMSSGELVTPGSPSDWDAYFSLNWISDYFSTYPNNLVFLSLEIFAMNLLKTLGILTVRHALMFFILIDQCLIFISLISVYFILHRETNWFIALFGWFFSLVLFGISFWTLVPYTDNISLFVVVSAVNCYSILSKQQICTHQDSNRFNLFLLFCIGFLAYFGFKIKPQTLFIFVGIFLNMFINLLSSNYGCFNLNLIRRKVSLLFDLLSLVFGILTSVLFVFMLTSPVKTKLNIDESKTFSFYHYMMMGSNPETDGSFLADDVNYSNFFTDFDSRRQADIDRFQKRIASYGKRGLLIHLGKKQLVNWSDAEFGWECEGGFYHYCLSDSNLVAKIFASFPGKIISCIKQIFWCMLLDLIVLSSIYDWDYQKSSFVCAAAILCLLLFELIFEARARYIYAFCPIIILFAFHHSHYSFRSSADK